MGKLPTEVGMGPGCARNWLTQAFVSLFLAGSSLAAQQLPVLGPQVTVLSPGMKTDAMQAEIDRIYALQAHNEFGPQRNLLLLLPGTYTLDIPVGFYTQVLGLGSTPDAVRVNGTVQAGPPGDRTNATTTFWRGIENVSIAPSGGTMLWAVSQAAPLRRTHVLGSMELTKNHGWGSGGWMSDDLIDGTVHSEPQQQWLARNTEWSGWTGSNWNMMFVGVNKPPAGEWPQPAFTKIDAAPVMREKPYLFLDGQQLAVRVPAPRTNARGITWREAPAAGRTLPISQFYIAMPEHDNADTMNAALALGKDLLLTPGVYTLAAPLHVTHKDSVVMGLGFATLQPANGTVAMVVDDVDGVIVAGILFDAGAVKSPTLLEVGAANSHRHHAADPISLFDVFFRVGGASAGKTVANLTIHANDTLVDHTWIWRADHGSHVGWTDNESANGLVVDGNDVTIYGLFVEHHQEYQVLWSGERGRTYFYQSEIPYDPPTQDAWRSGARAKGWASYKVADSVKVHEAWGLGIYSVFTKPNVVMDRAIEVPKTHGVRFHHMITVALGKLGAINHVIDDKGEATEVEPKRVTPKVAEFP